VPGFRTGSRRPLTFFETRGPLLRDIESPAPSAVQSYCGYWITEHMGSSIAFSRPCRAPSGGRRCLTDSTLFQRRPPEYFRGQAPVHRGALPAFRSRDAASTALQTAIRTLDKMLLHTNPSVAPSFSRRISTSGFITFLQYCIGKGRCRIAPVFSQRVPHLRPGRHYPAENDGHCRKHCRAQGNQAL